MNARAAAATFGEFARNGLGVPILVMMFLAMMVLPLPAFLLDILFTFNITRSIMILLAVIDVRSEARMGGTRASFDRWQRNAGALEMIDLRELRAGSATPRLAAPQAARARLRTRRDATPVPEGAPTGAAHPAQARPQRGLKTMLFADFAGYSRLHDAFAPLFQHRFLEIGGQQIAA